MSDRSAGSGEPASGGGKAGQASDGETPEPSLLYLARQAQLMRATVAKLFPRDMFRDSAWDILLELFVADQMDRAICVKDLIQVSGEAPTSALRRIDRLEDAGLLRRRHDSPDHRRVSVTLTPKGNDTMNAVLGSLINHRKSTS